MASNRYSHSVSTEWLFFVKDLPIRTLWDTKRLILQEKSKLTENFTELLMK